MNLPSPDEQLDLHGPRAQLPFEQTHPQFRAGIKSSHESLEQDKALIASNGIITSDGPPDSPLGTQAILVSPVPVPGQRRPGRAAAESDPKSNDSAAARDSPSPTNASPRPTDREREGDAIIAAAIPEPMVTTVASIDLKVFVQETQPDGEVLPTSFLSRLWNPFRRVLRNADNAHAPPSPSHHARISHPTFASSTAPHSTSMHNRAKSAQLADTQRAQQARPLNTSDRNGTGSFGTFGHPAAKESNGLPPTKRTRFESLVAMFKRFMGFVGPGYIISVGYMDPGNWATDLAGGSSFGYMLLFIILLSNVMAVILQGLAIKLGVVSGLDLAQACRKFTPKYVNWVLYILAELAIIACDLAEVIGSAVALNLLFKIPLPWGVVITAADVLLVLFAFRDDQSVKSRQVFEALVIILVSTVGICFTIDMAYAKPVAKDVFKGFLPNIEILTNKEALFLSIAIIGATVMPHNLYLHSSIVKLRTSRELNNLASSQVSMSSTADLMTMEQSQSLLGDDKGAISLKHSTIRSTLRYTFWDSTIALTFALYVNSAILIVSAATFKYKYPDVDNSGLADFFDAFHLLSEYLGTAAGYVFAVALLMAGQSSTLTATLAGQIIMEGFLGASYLKPWVRRLMTRCLAIIPALAIVIIKGQNGLSQLLLVSQVALSIQLPFAVIPLVLFTSMSRCMTIPVQDNDDKPGELSYGVQSGGDLKTVIGGAAAVNEEDGVTVPSVGDEETLADDPRSSIGAGSGFGVQISGSATQPVLMHNFANSWWLVVISVIISFVLLALNFYLLVLSIQGA